MTIRALDIELAIDRNGDGDFDDAGENVTADVLAETGIRCYRGRDSARAISPLRVGDLQTELNNHSGDYSPGSTVEAGRPIRLVVDDTPLWSGHLDLPVQHPESDRESVELTAFGLAGRLRGVTISTSLYRDITTDIAMGHVLDAAGWLPDDRDLGRGATTLTWWWADEQDAWDALQGILGAEGPGAALYEGADGAIVFRGRRELIQRVVSNTPQTTVASTGAGPRIAEGFEFDAGLENVINEVSIRVVARSPKDIEAVWQFREQLTLLGDETRTFKIKPSVPFQEALMPVADTDYTVSAGGIADVSLDRASGASVTLSLTATPEGVTLTSLQVRAKPLGIDADYSVANNLDASESIARHGRRPLPSEATIWPELSHNVAQDLADATVGWYRGGRQQARVPLLNSDAVSQEQQVTRDLDDRVHVDASSGAFDLDRNFHILGIEHEIQNQRILRTVWHCEEASDNEYAVWGAGWWDQGLWGF